MSKRRVTLTLDEDVIAAFRDVGPSLSATINEMLRGELDDRHRQQARLEWLDELDAKYGAPTPEDIADVDAFLKENGLPYGDPVDRAKPNAA